MLIWSADANASLFSAYFDTKQCRDNFLKSYSCDPFPALSSAAFRFSFVRNLLRNLDPFESKFIRI